MQCLQFRRVCLFHARAIFPFPIENVLINMHKLNFEVWQMCKKGRNMHKYEHVAWRCLRILIAQSWFGNMQFQCRQSEKLHEMFCMPNAHNEHINKQKCTALI